MRGGEKENAIRVVCEGKRDSAMITSVDKRAVNLLVLSLRVACWSCNEDRVCLR